MSIKHVIRYFRPPLPRIDHLAGELRTPFDMRTASRDEQLIMSTMRTRSPEGVQALLVEYGVSTAAELIPLLPRRRRARLRERVRVWLMRLEGAQALDPLIRERRQERSERRNDGLTVTSFDRF